MRFGHLLAVTLAAASMTWALVDALPSLAAPAGDEPAPDLVSPAAVKLIAMTMPKPEPVNPWRRVKITTYGPGYHGKLTNSGERFDKNKLTAAAPVKGKTKAGRHIPSIPFGTYVEVRYGARSVIVKINETCIGGTLDLSRAAMTELLGRYEETTVRGEWRVVR